MVRPETFDLEIFPYRTDFRCFGALGSLKRVKCVAFAAREEYLTTRGDCSRLTLDRDRKGLDLLASAMSATASRRDRPQMNITALKVSLCIDDSPQGFASHCPCS